MKTQHTPGPWAIETQLTPDGSDLLVVSLRLRENPQHMTRTIQRLKMTENLPERPQDDSGYLPPPPPVKTPPVGKSDALLHRLRTVSALNQAILEGSLMVFDRKSKRLELVKIRACLNGNAIQITI